MRGPTNPRDTLNARVQKPSGPPPISEGWTPDIPRLDPRCTRIGPPMHGDWTPDVQGHKTPHPFRRGPGTSWDSRLYGIWDFVGLKTSRDPGLCGIQDFVRFRTSWDSRLRGIQDSVGFKTSRDPGLHGMQDFVRFRTLWDSRLRGTQDFVGSRTWQDNRNFTHVGPGSCSVVFSKRTQTFRIKL